MKQFSTALVYQRIINGKSYNLLRVNICYAHSPEEAFGIAVSENKIDESNLHLWKTVEVKTTEESSDEAI